MKSPLELASESVRRLNPGLFGVAAGCSATAGDLVPRRRIEEAPAAQPVTIPPAPAAGKKNKKKRKGPNQTEKAYRALFIDARDDVAWVGYEALTIRTEAGFKYTGDWAVRRKDGGTEIHESKGPWESRDAYIRWCQAAQEWPNVRFFWGKREKGGEWKTEERNHGE